MVSAMRPRMLRTSLATLTAGLAAAGCLVAAGPAAAVHDGPPRHACSPAVSLTGYSDALDKTTYDARMPETSPPWPPTGAAPWRLFPTAPPSSGWTRAP